MFRILATFVFLLFFAWPAPATHLHLRLLDLWRRNCRFKTSSLLTMIRKETSNVIMDGYISTDSSKLTPIGDGAALLKPSARWVNAPAPLSLYHSSPQRSLLRSVLSPIRSCSSCLFPSRVFNQIASTTNLFLPYST